MMLLESVARSFEQQSEGAQAEGQRAELLEHLIHKRTNMFGAKAASWIQLLREWEPSQGLTLEVFNAAKSLVASTDGTEASSGRQRQVRRLNTATGRKLTGSLETSSTTDFVEVASNVSFVGASGPPPSPSPPARTALLAFPPPSSARSRPPSQGSTFRRQRPLVANATNKANSGPEALDVSMTASTRTPSASSSQVPMEEGLSSDQRAQELTPPSAALNLGAVDVSCERRQLALMFRNNFLGKFCIAFEEAAAQGKNTAAPASLLVRGVELVHWLCRRPSSPVCYLSFCHGRNMVATLVKISASLPIGDTADPLFVFRALRTLLADASGENPESEKHCRIREACHAGLLDVVTLRLKSHAVPPQPVNREESVQLFDCIHGIMDDVLHDEIAQAAAVRAGLVPVCCDLIDRLIREPLIWPRVLSLLIDAVTAVPLPEYIQRSVELSKGLRRVKLHDANGLPTVLLLRLQGLKARSVTRDGLVKAEMDSEANLESSAVPEEECTRATSRRKTAACDGLRERLNSPSPAVSEVKMAGQRRQATGDCTPPRRTARCQTTLPRVRRLQPLDVRSNLVSA